MPKSGPVRPITVDALYLVPLLSVSLRTLRTLDYAGLIPRPIRLGKKVLWRLDEIHAWLEAGAPSRATWEARGPTAK